jgi:hypothetical protein
VRTKITVQTSGTRKAENNEYSWNRRKRKTAKKNAAKSCWRDMVTRD